MGSSARRTKTKQRLHSASTAKRQQNMSPGTKAKIQTSYKEPKEPEGKNLAAEFEHAFENQDAEWKATERSRKTMPRDPNKRARVLQNLMKDEASKVFADAIGYANRKELAALRLLAANIRVAVVDSKQGNANTNEQRQFRKIVAAVVASETPRSARLLRETAKSTGSNYERLCSGIVFRERLLKKDVRALFALEVTTHCQRDSI